MSTLAVSHPALQELLDQLGPVAVLVGDAVPVRNHNDDSGMPPSAPLAVVHETYLMGMVL